MKATDQYPTPQVDAIAGKVYPPATEVCPADFARTLEQQNAALRKALEQAHHAMNWHRWNEETDRDCMEYRAVEFARAVLAATEKL